MSSMRPYADLWRVPGAPTLLVAGVVGRLGASLGPLAMLMLVQQRTGSYTPAGVADGLLAVAGAVAVPLLGRLADRVGPSPVLVATGLLQPAAMALLLVAAHLGHLPLIFLAAALTGATLPPSTAAIRGAWTELTEPATGRTALRPTALAADTTLFELCYILGPLIFAAITLFSGPDLAIVVTAVTTCAGTVALARGRAMRSCRPHPAAAPTRGLGALAVPGFPRLLASVGLLGVAFGLMAVTVPAFATAHLGPGAGTAAGVLLGVWGIGSAIGGVWYGVRPMRAALTRQYARLGAVLAVAVAANALMPDVWWLGASLIIGGVVIAPALTVQNSLVGEVAPASMRVEAYTWWTSFMIGGSAVGGALSGLVVEQPGGVRVMFLLGGLVVAASALVTGRLGRRAADGGRSAATVSR